MNNDVHNVHKCNYMTKKISKKEEVKPVKKVTTQEAKRLILKRAKVSVDPEVILKKFSDEYLPLINAKDNSKEKEVTELISELSLAFSSETGHMLMKAVNEEYRGLALQMKRDLQEEFDCMSFSEKMLVDLMVNAYIKKLRYSDKMEHNQQYIGHKYDSYRCFLSKEIDRAYRQFLSALETMRVMKQPAMKVNIKTNTAFVGENQQFNTKVENNEAK